MKTHFILGLATVLALTFSSCKKGGEDTPDLPIKNLELPQSSSEVPLKAGEPVVIKGSGFKQDCQIWLTPATKAESLQATIIEVTDSRIVFSAKVASGEHSIVLKQANEEFELGKLNFRVIKRVKTITPNTIGGNFIYDDQGRLTGYQYEDGFTVTYKYQDGKIIETRVGKNRNENTEYTLDKGIITSVSDWFKPGEKPTKTYNYTYSPDYNLISVGDNMYKYTWENGNMTQFEFAYTYDKSEFLTYKLKYSEHLNYTTFDPCDFIDTRLGCIGNTIKNLVSEYEYISDGKTIKCTFAYEFDQDNYPIKATVVYNGETTVYTVTYEQ